MKRRQKEKIEKKRLQASVTTKDVGLAGIGVPSTIMSSPLSALPGSPFSTPMTTASHWPAPNLWYAQGRDAAKKIYYEYINTLNQYTNCDPAQPDRKLQLAGQLNNFIVSMIQGVTIATEAEEAAAKRARMGDRAGKIEQDVIAYTLDEMLKVIWIHDTAAHSQQFPGLEEKLLEASIAGRINRMNEGWKATDVGIPLLTAQEADTIFNDQPLQPPIDAPAAEIDATPEQTSGAPSEETPAEGPSTEESLIPNDEAPSPENEAAEEFIPDPDRNVVDASGEDTGIELADEEIPEESQQVEGEPQIATFDQLKNQEGDEEELDMSGPNQDLKIKWVAFIDQNPEKAAELFQEAVAGDETPVEEVQPAEEVPGEEEVVEEAPVGGAPEEVAEEPPITEEIVNEPAEEAETPPEEAVTDETPVTDEVTETVETPEGEATEEETVELPEEGETVYCPECDRDVTEEEIAACENENCPYKQVAEEEENVSEVPEEKGFGDIETKHLIMVDHEDHHNCRVYHLGYPDFPGAECEFCLDHEKAVSYAFEKKGWTMADGKAWVQKQFKNNSIKTKSAEKIVEENLDVIDETILKQWAGGEEKSSEGIEIDPEAFGNILSAALERQKEKHFGPIEKRLSNLEA